MILAVLTSLDSSGFDLAFHSYSTGDFATIKYTICGGIYGLWNTSLSVTISVPPLLRKPMTSALCTVNIYGGLTTNWECDIAWKIAHGVLKTRSYLRTWRQFKVSKFCTMCSQIETTTHVFCDCVLTTPVWRWVSSVINCLYSTPVALTPQIILLCHGLPRGKHGKQFHQPNRIAAFLVKLILNEP